MARLKLPEKAYYSEREDDLIWHLRWAGDDSGPSMVCGKMVFREFRVERPIEDIDEGSLCAICLGAIEVEK